MALPLALTSAEKEVVNDAAEGDLADFRVGNEQADDPAQGAAWDDGRSVRAEVIYALAVGTNPAWPVHAKGVRIRGAKIVGALDFEAATLRCPLALLGCYIAEPVTLRGATIPALYLNGSHLPGLSADGVNVRGDVFLRKGFTAAGEVRLLGAQIGGQLACVGGSFSNQNGPALNADGVSVRGDVFLHEGFTATGEVRLLGAQIGGDLECDGGSFSNQNGPALNADRVNVRGNVFLRGGFTAAGEVRLIGAQIGGDLSCDGGSFTNQNGPALLMQRATVEGTFFMRELAGAPVGRVDLMGAKVGILCDDAKSWPAKDYLALDGFVYEAIAPGSPISAKERIEWFGRQEKFRPQPYEQLIRVLRNMGHEREARKIAIAKQKALRKSGALGGLGKAWNYLVGGVVGHGYRPILALGWLASFVLLATMLFWSASRSGRMVPAPQHHLSAPASRHEGRSSCSERPQPFLYAVETIVPGLDLHQKSCWWLAPKDGTDRLYLLFEFLVIVYYLASLAVAATLAAALAGLIKRD